MRTSGRKRWALKPSENMRHTWDTLTTQGIGEYMAKECNVSYDRVFACSLGAKLVKAVVNVRFHIDVTLLHSCTIFSLCTCSLFQHIRVGLRLPQNRVACVTSVVLRTFPTTAGGLGERGRRV